MESAKLLRACTGSTYCRELTLIPSSTEEIDFHRSEEPAILHQIIGFHHRLERIVPAESAPKTGKRPLASESTKKLRHARKHALSNKAPNGYTALLSHNRCFSGASFLSGAASCIKNPRAGWTEESMPSSARTRTLRAVRGTLVHLKAEKESIGHLIHVEDQGVRWDLWSSGRL